MDYQNEFQRNQINISISIFSTGQQFYICVSIINNMDYMKNTVYQYSKLMLAPLGYHFIKKQYKYVMNELSGSGESVFMCGNFQQMHDWHSIEKIPSSFVDVVTSGNTVSNINLQYACFATFIIISKIYLCAYNKFSIIIITSVCCMYLQMLFPSIYLQVLSSWRTVLQFYLHCLDAMGWWLQCSNRPSLLHSVLVWCSDEVMYLHVEETPRVYSGFPGCK